MCGRFLLVDIEKIEGRFNVHILETTNLRKRYNISPGQPVQVIFQESPNKIADMIWGLVPHWAKDPSIGNRMINARAETLLERPAFRDSLLKRRCLIPANGFYEWKKVGNIKVPYLIHLKNFELFAFAGLYDVWKDERGNLIRTFTIITVSANSFVRDIHERMPVILKREYEEVWIDKNERNVNRLMEILQPYPSEFMSAYPVSKKVNNPNYDAEDLIKPV
ncbi:MAG: hypothetical protein CBR30_08055 [Dictyoglomus sp. NZ13-RE01]|nr:MAG: hypothetical protein CBR30_08055 [Dictyoglomus sp. NZ13-RE01]